MSGFYKYHGEVWYYNPVTRSLQQGEGNVCKVVRIDQWDDGLPKIGSEYALPCDFNGRPVSVTKDPKKSAWDTQVGGNHYTKMKIQPFQYSMANGLDPMQHTIVKYVSRFRDKNGIEDLEKAKQTIDLLIAYEKEKKCN